MSDRMGRMYAVMVVNWEGMSTVMSLELGLGRWAITVSFCATADRLRREGRREFLFFAFLAVFIFEDEIRNGESLVAAGAEFFRSHNVIGRLER